MTRTLPLIALLSLLGGLFPAGRGIAMETLPADLHEQAHHRRPVAALWLEPGRTLVVANRRSGTLSVVDVSRRAVRGEWKVAARPADVALPADSKHLLLVDDKTHELIVVHFDGSGQILFDGRVRVTAYPQKIAIAPDGRTAAITGLWSRAVELVELRPPESATAAEVWNAAFPRVVATVALPFAAREVAFLPDGEHVLVVDAFGGGLAVIQRRQHKITAQCRLDAHNLRGLVVDAERQAVLIAGQRLDEHLPADAQNVGDGALIKNRIWRIPLARLIEPTSTTAAGQEVIELNRPRSGAGDPEAVAPTSDGDLLAALGGTGELAIVGDEGKQVRCGVGLRPVAVLPLPDERQAVVVNQLSDSLSLVDLATQHVEEIALGPRPDPYPRDRGEAMFFNARLSRHGFMSCHSCHTDGHTNGRRADTLGDGAYGNPKRVLSLMGTALTDHWSWNGQLRELRDQVRQSFESTMHAPKLSAEQHDDVVAFLHTLPFVPPLRPQVGDAADQRQVERGRTLFAAWNCGQCHVGPLTYTSQGAFDVGLRDERGPAKFNPPTLRGVGHAAGLFHDNRAATLDEALRVHRHQVPDEATDQDLAALVRFLQSL